MAIKLYQDGATNFRVGLAGAAGNGKYLFPLPDGYVIDMANLVGVGSGTYNSVSVCGVASCFNGTNDYPGTMNIYNSTNFILNYGSPSSAMSSGAMSLNSSANIVISFRLSIPIVGW